MTIELGPESEGWRMSRVQRSGVGHSRGLEAIKFREWGIAHDDSLGGCLYRWLSQEGAHGG